MKCPIYSHFDIHPGWCVSWPLVLRLLRASVHVISPFIGFIVWELDYLGSLDIDIISDT